MRHLTNRRFLTNAGAVVLLAGLSWAIIHYTGDQAGKWAESGSFTIDTSDPEPVTRVFSLAVAAQSPAFTIDTRDSDSESRPFTAQVSGESGTFAVDTRDPDTVVFATSQAVTASSPTFAIDTRGEDGSSHLISDFFTVDTRDPDEAVFALSLSVADWLEGFTIDTRQPRPEDSVGNGLHDLWELIYLDTVGAHGRDDDLDGDGLTNFFEFAFGTDPQSPNATSPIEFWIETNGSEPKLVVRYWRHILAARMVDFAVRTSGDLREWKAEISGWTEVGEVMHDNGYLERITMERPWEGDPPERLFLSLQLLAKPVASGAAK